MDLKTFAQVIRELAEEKGVAEPKVIETIELAIAAAYKKDYGKKGQMIRARFNADTGELQFAQIKTVLDESMVKSEEEIAAEEALRQAGSASLDRPTPRAKLAADEGEERIGATGAEEAALRKVRFNPERHIMLAEARESKPEVQPGDEIEFSLQTHSDFGRIASQTAKQVIIQRIREAEREATYNEYKSREGEIVSGTVQRLEGRNVFIDLGRGVGLIPADEQIPRERYAVGERVRALLIHVEKDIRGSGVLLSRSHPRFLARLFELEVPEVSGGVVEIKAMAREPGSRTKVAVASGDDAIDPVGSMVGQRGVRVSTVMNELGGEKIDIIEWSEDPARFVANALSPAKVLDVSLFTERREARAIVPEDQLSLAIGKGGQNVRLAAKLTGWKIDVRSSAKPPEPSASASPETEAEAGEVLESAGPTAEEVIPGAKAPEAAPETPQTPEPETAPKPKRKRTAQKPPSANAEEPTTPISSL